MVIQGASRSPEDDQARGKPLWNEQGKARLRRQQISRQKPLRPYEKEDWEQGLVQSTRSSKNNNNNNNSFWFVVTFGSKSPTKSLFTSSQPPSTFALKDLIGFCSGTCSAPCYISSECFCSSKSLKLEHTQRRPHLFSPAHPHLVGPMAASPYGKGQ